MRKRVVVTGIGMVTPLGIGVEENWRALLEGKSGIGTITSFDASSFPTRIAGEVRGLEPAHLPGGYAGDFDRLEKNSRFALAAGRMALADAGLLEDSFDRDRFGVYLGSGEAHCFFAPLFDMITGSLDGSAISMSKFPAAARSAMDPVLELEQQSYAPARHLARAFGARGPNSCCLTACAASSQALGEATEIIRRGDAVVMLSGGSHSMIYPLGLMGFSLLRAISTRNEEPEKASRPFDADRDGFVIGEGSGILVLEEMEHARERGAEIYGEIGGYGASSDAYRVTDVPPDGHGAIAAMRAALSDAVLAPADIGYINAHGTSTLINDVVETTAIKEVFGEEAYRIPVSSTKSMTGHLIAAAGAIELIACLLVLRHGVIPPTINQERSDPGCDLDYVPNAAREHAVAAALSNSFGFGGQNICLIVTGGEELR
ncbi:MAG: beta-ketoacyl-[acyl-carrier-protein] synthase II [Candidatus Tritonobacter lacicola]|nr:beta-ketoacyl-[acyl-carrier-protein] synthase II [Candidatus Tritonobacter lacicola]